MGRFYLLLLLTILSPGSSVNVVNPGVNSSNSANPISPENTTVGLDKRIVLQTTVPTESSTRSSSTSLTSTTSSTSSTTSSSTSSTSTSTTSTTHPTSSTTFKNAIEHIPVVVDSTTKIEQTSGPTTEEIRASIASTTLKSEHPQPNTPETTAEPLVEGLAQHGGVLDGNHTNLRPSDIIHLLDNGSPEALEKARYAISSWNETDGVYGSHSNSTLEADHGGGHQNYTRFPVITVNFDRVKDPFIILTWILLACLGKIGKYQFKLHFIGGNNYNELLHFITLPLEY